MKLFKLAIVSHNDASDVIGTLKVYANNEKDALKRARHMTDMEGTRFYPLNKKADQEIEPEQVEETEEAA